MAAQKIDLAMRVLFGAGKLQQLLASQVQGAASMDVAGYVSAYVRAYARRVPDLEYHGPTEGVFAVVTDLAVSSILDRVLDNATERRDPKSPIIVSMAVEKDEAILAVANSGPKIAEDWLRKVFDYGVSTAGHERGQGLFVVRELATMLQGSALAANTDDGVVIAVRLPLAAPPRDSAA